MARVRRAALQRDDVGAAAQRSRAASRAGRPGVRAGRARDGASAPRGSAGAGSRSAASPAPAPPSVMVSKSARCSTSRSDIVKRRVELDLLRRVLRLAPPGCLLRQRAPRRGGSAASGCSSAGRGPAPAAGRGPSRARAASGRARRCGTPGRTARTARAGRGTRRRASSRSRRAARPRRSRARAARRCTLSGPTGSPAPRSTRAKCMTFSASLPAPPGGGTWTWAMAADYRTARLARSRALCDSSGPVRNGESSGQGHRG